MTREKDTVSTEDAGYKTESGNHAAGSPANDTTQVNREPNINASQQRSAAGSQGGHTMTEQSIGGRNAQDGIQGTPSGTQGGQSGQGVDQGGQSQQRSQGQSDYLGGSPGGQGGPATAQGARPDIQYSPQESNHDQYGDQETGATSGQVGDGRTPQQVAHSGSQPTQHSEGRDDGSLPSAQRLGGLIPIQEQQQKQKQQQQQQPQRDAKGGPGSPDDARSRQSADSDDVDALQADASGGERVGMGQRGNSQQSDKARNAQSDVRSNQAVPDNRTDNEQSDRHLGMQGTSGEPGHDIDDIGSKHSSAGGSRSGSSEDQR
ncbi:hypothetical protein IP91_02697 [Pseudoduganella lurida]|uniref:Uncharacterized protein n=1 Tax=Pseudoduganella lurida TaxID=1036180 RepID=A0A562R883_9BURK|nr:hypothetical protein [Pseudoduganella lurida]TWI65289.1 hypothetical protein IP91_02697 [Pseudoduganella lurida]